MKRFGVLALLMIGAACPAFSMHIAEGFLPAHWCAIWAFAFVPFVIVGYRKISKINAQDPQAKVLYAVAGAFVFILSSLKLPSVAGSSSHLTGMALGALLFGASSMSIIGLIVLLFQALLLAHGGITTLGANAFSMAIVGSFVALWVYQVGQLCKAKQWLAVFLAAFFSDVSVYVCTSVQLSVAFQGDQVSFWDNLVKFLSIFAITQLPLALVEGALTAYLFRLIVRNSNTEWSVANFYMKKAENRVG